MTVYIHNSFNTDVFGDKADDAYNYMLGAGIIYPFLYDTIQMIRTGREYFKEMWNYSDMVF